MDNENLVITELRERIAEYERRIARHDEGKPWARNGHLGADPGAEDTTGPSDIGRGEIGEAPA